MGGHRAESCEIGELHGLLGRVERVGARNGALADGGRVGVVLVEGVGACTLADANLGKVGVELFLDFAGSYGTAGLGEEVLGFKHAVGTGVVPSAQEVALRNGGAAAEE
mgnify:CR=1 FL=1